MRSVDYARQIANDYWKQVAIDQAMQNDDVLLKEINDWAIEQAKTGLYEGYFDLSAFKQRHPDYILDMNKDRHRINLLGYRIRGGVQKECRFHPMRILVNWMNDSDYDYYYRGGRR